MSYFPDINRVYIRPNGRVTKNYVRSIFIGITHPFIFLPTLINIYVLKHLIAALMGLWQVLIAIPCVIALGFMNRVDVLTLAKDPNEHYSKEDAYVLAQRVIRSVYLTGKHEAKIELDDAFIKDGLLKDK